MQRLVDGGGGGGGMFDFTPRTHFIGGFWIWAFSEKRNFLPLPGFELSDYPVRSLVSIPAELSGLVHVYNARRTEKNHDCTESACRELQNVL
jgi:hypothetical protein